MIFAPILPATAVDFEVGQGLLMYYLHNFVSVIFCRRNPRRGRNHSRLQGLGNRAMVVLRRDQEHILQNIAAQAIIRIIVPTKP